MRNKEGLPNFTASSWLYDRFHRTLSIAIFFLQHYHRLHNMAIDLAFIVIEEPSDQIDEGGGGVCGGGLGGHGTFSHYIVSLALASQH